MSDSSSSVSIRVTFGFRFEFLIFVLFELDEVWSADCDIEAGFEQFWTDSDWKIEVDLSNGIDRSIWDERAPWMF